MTYSFSTNPTTAATGTYSNIAANVLLTGAINTANASNDKLIKTIN